MKAIVTRVWRPAWTGAKPTTDMKIFEANWDYKLKQEVEDYIHTLIFDGHVSINIVIEK